MENKTPKEIWVTSIYEHTNGKYFGSWMSVVKVNISTDIKYLSEASVNEMMAEKDREIARLKSELNDIDRYLDSNSYPAGDRYGNAYSIIERIENN